MDPNPIFIIGPGEVGRRMGGALKLAGRDVAYVGRTEGWGEALSSPEAWKVLAMREDDPPGALERFPAGERDRLVLVQNGFLEAVLGEAAEGTTRGLIWFTSKGDFFRVLQPSPFHGPLAGTLCPLLEAGGIPAAALAGQGHYAREMVLKGVWNCVVGLPLAVHDVDLATYLRDHRPELEELLTESALAASARYGVDVRPAEALDRLLGTTTELGWVRGGVKALAWRNGAVARFGRLHGVPTPVTDDLLRRAGHDPGGSESSPPHAG